ncbi:DUF6084 family protein [Streptomyces sp. NPDC059740]|uniref:DUF6084 family protein n=1 Tax=Streptomyces sp. NPDC059740 TaxID=3346926 RepID=UPI003662DA92
MTGLSPLSSALTFTCLDVRADPRAAGPTLVFRLRVSAGDDRRVHAVALRCQFRVEPGLREYTDEEADGLRDVFGERRRWGTTLQPMQFAQVCVMVPGFSGATEVDVPVPCTYDMEVASARYLEALRGGEVPLLLLFSGSAFVGPRGFQVEPVPWDREATCRLPVAVWREMVEQHFPGCGWLRLPRPTMDALLAFRSRHALPTWEATVEALLARSADGHPGTARAQEVRPRPGLARLLQDERSAP